MDVQTNQIIRPNWQLISGYVLHFLSKTSKALHIPLVCGKHQIAYVIHTVWYLSCHLQGRGQNYKICALQLS